MKIKKTSEITNCVIFVGNLHKIMIFMTSGALLDEY